MSSRGVTWMTFPREKVFSIEYFGESEMGKTHNAFTYPEGAACDTLSEGEVWQIAEKFGNERVVRASTFEDIKRFVDYCVMNPKIKSVIIDSGTDLDNMAETQWLREHHRTSVFVPGEGAFQWAQVYEMIDDLIQKVKRANKYLVVTSRIKDEFVESEIDGKKISVRSGKRVHDGYKKFKYGYGLSVRVQLVNGIVDAEGKTHFEDWVFGKVVKNRFVPKRVQKPYFFNSSYQGLVENGELFEVFCKNHNEKECDLNKCVNCSKCDKKNIVEEAKKYLVKIGEIKEAK